MSVKIMAWAWAQSVPPATKAVLLALADHADDDGVAWPGRKGLAAKLDIDDRNVTRHIAKLCGLGLVKSIPQYRPDGSQGTNLYHLLIHDISITPSMIILSPPLDENVQPPSAKSSRGVGGALPPNPPLSPPLPTQDLEPSLEPSEETSPNGEVFTPLLMSDEEWLKTLRGIPKWQALGEPRLLRLLVWVKKKGWTEEQLERSAIGLAGVQARTLNGYTNLVAAFQRRLNQGYDDPAKERTNDRPREDMGLASPGSTSESIRRTKEWLSKPLPPV